MIYEISSGDYRFNIKSVQRGKTTVYYVVMYDAESGRILAAYQNMNKEELADKLLEKSKTKNA